MNAKSLWIIIAVIVIVLIGYLFYAQANPASAPADQTATTTDTTTASPVTPSPVTPAVTGTSGASTGGATSGKAVTITYGANGFSPASVTVPVGTKVTWVNQGGGRMWIGSAQHPTHTGYDGTSVSEHCTNGVPDSASVFDQCSAGNSFSFTFTKAGTWPYHNHANSSDYGTVIVTAR